MLLDRGMAKQVAELVSTLLSIPKDPETALATKPECPVINLVWPNDQLSCQQQYPLTQKPIWHLWDHTRVGGYRCIGTDCEPFQQDYQHKSMANCSWFLSSQCFCWSRSLTSHIQIRRSEHLVLCYSARYQMLHRNRFMFSILKCSFTSFIALPLGKLSDTTQHIHSEHQEAI